MKKQAVIIYGPPGSGKGTQAELLARKYNFIHFDTGRYLESLVHDPHFQKNSIIKRERKLFDTGKLNTPVWVLRIVREATEKISKSGWSIVYSGSPRTMFEAFGDPPALTSSRRSQVDKKHKSLFSVLSGLYGKKNITIIFLKINAGTTLKRNGSRFVCSVCGLPKLSHSKSTRCSFCDGSFRKRTLDNPAVIRVRLEEFKNRTYPILAKAKKSGFKIIAVNGEPPPYKVHAEIINKLKLK